MGEERLNVISHLTERLNTMSLSKSIAEGVNLLSGRERKEYGEFVAGWLHLNTAFAKYLDRPFDDHVRETYEGLSAEDFLGLIKAAGWSQGEANRCVISTRVSKHFQSLLSLGWLMAVSPSPATAIHQSARSGLRRYK
jgi:hypothetical protein